MSQDLTHICARAHTHLHTPHIHTIKTNKKGIEKGHQRYKVRSPLHSPQDLQECEQKAPFQRPWGLRSEVTT